MKAIWAISSLTFREAVRSKILYLLLFFSAFLIAFSWIIGKLTVGDEMKIIKDLGLSSIHFFGILITVFIGIDLVFREMEKRTVYLILSKPVARYQFMLGKFLGLATTLLCVLTVLAAMFYAILVLKGESNLRVMTGFYLIYLEWLLMAGLALLFSSFSTPLLSTMMTLALFFAGHLTQSLLLLERRIPSANWLLSVLYYALPNLEVFNIRSQLVHDLSVSPFYFLQSTLYWALYLGTLLMFSIYIFQKKDFV
ncbi:MAG: hypothetical protein C5B54_09970 [Acidobacteria bacterium]|nr:MAG: hypothetical protein C5B54_09970 [Acidobacteriota bacterium]